MDAMVVAIVALVLGAASFVLSLIAYSRSGGRSEIQALRHEVRAEVESLRQAQRALVNDLAMRIRLGYEETLDAMGRVEERLDEIRKSASAELNRALDSVSRRAADVRQQARDGLERLRSGASVEAQMAQAALAERARRLEASVQVLFAKGEMVRAERLADKGEFVDATKVLEDAVSRVRDARTKAAVESGQERGFDDVVDALVEAIRQVRARAKVARAQIEHAMAASDSLLGSMEAREELH